MKRIKSIHIKNVKGVKDETFELNLVPNKPTILVAPNGFGKSSFTIAFKSLLKTKLKLDLDNYHKRSEKYKPELYITTSDEYGQNEQILFANTKENNISKYFDIEVINNPLKAKNKSVGLGMTSPVIGVEPITIRNTVPIPKSIEYSVQDYRSSLIENGKIFSNISDLLKNKKLICELKDNIEYKKLTGAKKKAEMQLFKKNIKQTASGK